MPVPASLSFSTTRRIRFEEVDPLNIVWHGRYPSYLEDGRVAFGKKYSLHYLDMQKANFVTPIKEMHIDYIKPLYFDEKCTIQTTLHWSDAARLNFSYQIYNDQNELVTRASTVQLFLSLEGTLFMAKPDYYAQFCECWKNGDFN